MSRLFSAFFAALVGAALLLAAQPAEAQGRWLRAESSNFVIYTNESETSARRFAAQLETFDQVLRMYHGIDTAQAVDRKLPIYLLRNDADMQRIRPGASRSMKGYFTSSLEDTYAVAIGGEDNNSTLQHEYVHHFMLNRFPRGYPGWLVEGYAEYFMTLQEKGGYLDVGGFDPNRVSWLFHGSWLPWETVLTSRPSSLRDKNGVSMFYAQSWLLTHWFLGDSARQRQLSSYIQAVGRGQESVAAMTAATGQNPSQLRRTLVAYWNGSLPIRRISQDLVRNSPVTITPMPASAADVLLLTLRVKGDNGIDAPQDRTDGPVLLEDVRRAAARHPGDRLAELALARVEIKLGDLTKAETLLQRRLAADAADVEALQLLGSARLKAAEKADPTQARKLRTEAQGFIARAHKADPNRYETLILYAQAREGASNYPTANDVQVLVDALALAPQVGALRGKTAAALASVGRRADAINVLRPLAFDPHGGSAPPARAPC
jgi:hypothetical protein